MQVKFNIPTFTIALTVDSDDEDLIGAVTLENQTVAPNIGEPVIIVLNNGHSGSGIVKSRLFHYSQQHDGSYATAIFIKAYVKGRETQVDPDAPQPIEDILEAREWQCPSCAEINYDIVRPDHFIECPACGGIFEWKDVDTDEPEPTDTRAVAFNRGFDAFWESDKWPIDNPYKLGTSEYNFWRDGRNTALAQYNEATDAPQPPDDGPGGGE